MMTNIVVILSDQPETKAAHLVFSEALAVQISACQSSNESRHFLPSYLRLWCAKTGAA